MSAITHFRDEVIPWLYARKDGLGLLAEELEAALLDADGDEVTFKIEAGKAMSSYGVLQNTTALKSPTLKEMIQ